MFAVLSMKELPSLSQVNVADCLCTFTSAHEATDYADRLIKERWNFIVKRNEYIDDYVSNITLPKTNNVYLWLPFVREYFESRTNVTPTNFKAELVRYLKYFHSYRICRNITAFVPKDYDPPMVPHERVKFIVTEIKD